MAGDYTYDFSAFATDQAANQGGGMSFATGGAGGAGGASGPGNAGSMSGAGGPAAGAGGGMAGQIGQSPFGRLLDLPGVTAENLFANVNQADYAGNGGNPFAALGDSVMTGAYGGNPFAAIGPFVNDAVASGMGSGMGFGMGQQ